VKNGHAAKLDKKAGKRKAKPGWWCAVTDDVGFAPMFVGGERERWFDARADAVRLLSAFLGHAVSQDAVTLRWQQ
jgi:hypothetical protein